MSESSAGETVSAFLLGGFIGAVLGIILAPASGQETREKVCEWLDETKLKAKERLEKLEEEIKHRKEQLAKPQD